MIFMYMKNEKMKNICTLDTFYFSIKRLTPFPRYHKALNTNFLQQHYEDFNNDHNLQMSHQMIAQPLY
jgi:hypothetical protein